MQPLSGLQIRKSAIKRDHKCDSSHLDIWLLSVQINAEEREIYERVLSKEEVVRAGRFIFEADRARFITARGGLRWLLSSYCAVRPEALVFQLGDHGKPSLAIPPGTARFNVSHSGDYVLIGITAGSECGVDIEYSRAHLSEQQIAEHFFCPREVEWLRKNERGFVRLWTAKEAFIKAVGRGLSIPLSNFDITNVMLGDGSGIVLKTPGLEPRSVWVTELDLVEPYAAAAAVIGMPRTIRLMPE